MERKENLATLNGPKPAMGIKRTGLSQMKEAYLKMTLLQDLAGATVLCIWTVLSMCMRSDCITPKAVRSSAEVKTKPSRLHVS